MYVVTADQMRRAEEALFATGIPAAALMESAGRHVADVVAAEVVPGGTVTVACGVGNNAGDGLVAARYLANRGFRVRLLLTRPVERLSEMLQAIFSPLPAMGVELLHIGQSGLHEAVAGSDLMVDALLGIGTHGPPRGAIEEAVRIIHAAGPPVLSVDIPTGIDADTGRVYEPCVRATRTVAMSAPKLGQLLMPGAAYCGALSVVDVGIPHHLVGREAMARWVRPTDAASWFPPRPRDGHKGLFGKVLVIAGSNTMPGAAVLAVQAALRSGAGLCSWAGPSGVRPTIAAAAPEATLYPLPGSSDALSQEAVDSALKVARGRSVAVGPGIGLSEAAGRFVQGFLAAFDGPVVVDADALTHLATLGSWPHGRATVRVLTPHPKEMARLLGAELEDVLNDRLGAAREAARRYHAVVLLKGAPTLVAEPGGHVRICTAGNPVLAVGGSGDVLTGLIAGLLAQGLDPIDGAALGAVWHGAAADLLAEGGEDAAHTAGELVSKLAGARARLLREVNRHAL